MGTLNVKENEAASFQGFRPAVKKHVSKQHHNKMKQKQKLKAKATNYKTGLPSTHMWVTVELFAAEIQGVRRSHSFQLYNHHNPVRIQYNSNSVKLNRLSKQLD